MSSRLLPTLALFAASAFASVTGAGCSKSNDKSSLDVYDETTLLKQQLAIQHLEKYEGIVGATAASGVLTSSDPGSSVKEENVILTGPDGKGWVVTFNGGPGKPGDYHPTDQGKPGKRHIAKLTH